jgi:hypothetical protein
MANNPLQQIDAVLKPTVLDLWATVHELIDHAGDFNVFNFWQLVPEHEKASNEEGEFIDELEKKYSVPSREIREKFFAQQRRQEEAITRLYLAIGFVLGLRLSGASEDRIKCLMNTYSFGLSEPESAGG